MANPQQRQRRRLRAQGRCFVCRRKGQKAAECSYKSPAVKLPDLPVELLEAICDEIVGPLEGKLEMDDLREMFSLRLSCREVNAKLFHYFVRSFNPLILQSTYRSFERAVGISKVPALAVHVKIVVFNNEQEDLRGDYDELHASMNPYRTSERERRQNAAKIKAIGRKQSNNEHFQASGTDTIMLTEALRNLPNVHTVIIDQPTTEEEDTPVRKAQGSPHSSIAHTFSMLLAGLSIAEVKPRAFSTVWRNPHEENLNATTRV